MRLTKVLRCTNGDCGMHFSISELSIKKQCTEHPTFCRYCDAETHGVDVMIPPQAQSALLSECRTPWHFSGGRRGAIEDEHGVVHPEEEKLEDKDERGNS